jgi:hypothetical protein
VVEFGLKENGFLDEDVMSTLAEAVTELETATLTNHSHLWCSTAMTSSTVL